MKAGRPLLVMLFFFVVSFSLYAQSGAEIVESEQAEFRLRRVVEGLDHPWAMDFLPDGGVLITEWPGRLLLYRDGELQNIHGVPEVYAAGQGGLLDVRLHPDFQRNRLVYLSYAMAGPGGAGTALYRARLDGTRLTDGEVLY